MKNILCVHQGYELYGSDRSFALSVGTLKELYPNAKINVVIPKDGPIRQILEPVCHNLIIDEKLGILRKRELKKNPFKLMYKILRGIILAVSESKKYDLVYVNTIVVLDYILAARFMKCKRVLHIREIQTGVSKVIFSNLISFSKIDIIFNSLNTLKAYTLSKNQSTYIVLNGVSGFSEVTIKEQINVPIKILMLGRLSPLKGQMLLLKALNILNKKYDVEVRIVGEAFENQVEFKDELLRYIKEHHLEKCVAFKPFVENPKEDYEWSDIVIMPSIQPESFGRVAVEAMSASRCVVASNHGGVTEIIDDKKNGVLFTPNNVDSLVKEMELLLQNPSLIKMCVEQALVTFENKFSEKIYKKRFQEVISNLSDEY